jgi:hypothetical protein
VTFDTLCSSHVFSLPFCPLTMTLQGNCHCGRYRFELSGADLSQASTCACNHCRKAGCLLLPLSSELVYRCTRDDQKITRYQSEDLRKMVSQESAGHSHLGI